MYSLRTALRYLPQHPVFTSQGRSFVQPLRTLVTQQTQCLQRTSLTKLLLSETVGARSFHLSPNHCRVKKTKPTFEKIFSWQSFAFLVVVGGGYLYVIESVKKEKEAKAAKEQSKIIGQAALGGDWELTRLDGTKGGSVDLRGNFALLYFGFTHCPDICPEEIEKAVKVVDAIDANVNITKKLIPVFITIDPERDTAEIVKNYIAEFSSKMIGYVGTQEEIKEASRKFRVYFSKGPVDEDGDYIVDHSIIMYLVGPDGMFMDYYGQNKTAAEMTNSITLKMAVEEKKEKKSGGVLGVFG